MTKKKVEFYIEVDALKELQQKAKEKRLTLSSVIRKFVYEGMGDSFPEEISEEEKNIQSKLDHIDFKIDAKMRNELSEYAKANFLTLSEYCRSLVIMYRGRPINF